MTLSANQYTKTTYCMKAGWHTSEMATDLWRKQSIQYARQLRTEGALKKKRCVCNLPANWKHTSDSSLPIKGKSSDSLPAEVLTGRFIKLSALLRQFQHTHFATERCRQVYNRLLSVVVQWTKPFSAQWVEQHKLSNATLYFTESKRLILSIISFNGRP